MPEGYQPGSEPSEVKRYRSSFGDVDAIQLSALNGASVYEWADSGPIFAPVHADHAPNHTLQLTGLTIFTAAGRMKADFGDWIVRERTGRFFPYKQNLFEALFHEVSDA